MYALPNLPRGYGKPGASLLEQVGACLLLPKAEQMHKADSWKACLLLHVLCFYLLCEVMLL